MYLDTFFKRTIFFLNLLMRSEGVHPFIAKIVDYSFICLNLITPITTRANSFTLPVINTYKTPKLNFQLFQQIKITAKIKKLISKMKSITTKNEILQSQ
jgi:hypothetical protein